MKHFYLFALLCVLPAQAQINIPDPVFKDLLLSGYYTKDADGNSISIDLNNNGEIEEAEALLVYQMTVAGYSTSLEISSLEGIGFFSNLTRLDAADNALTALDISMLHNLQTINVADNQLTSLNVAGLDEVYLFYLGNNDLTTLDLSGMTALRTINFSYNPLTAIDVSGSALLEGLYMQGTTLSSIDVSGLAQLETLSASFGQLTSVTFGGNDSLDYITVWDNQLTQLDLSGCPNLTELNCSQNFLTELDLSHQVSLNNTNASNNQLVWISFKNGVGDIGQAVNFNQNPGLLYACADEFEQYQLNQKLNTYGYSSTIRTFYCDTDPGGYTSIIQGTQRFSQSGDCGSEASPASFQRYTAVTANGDQTTYFSNAFGQYRIPFPSGFASVTPTFQSSGFFTVTPALVETEFPAQQSPLTQDFCLTPNGSHTDVEVAIFPLTVARPGENAVYRIVLKNNGNVSASGTVSLDFDGSIADLVSSEPELFVSGESAVAWSFSDLAPLAATEFTVTLNLNTPMEDPAVSQGDTLHYVATAQTSAMDEVSTDNTAHLSQVVLASFDPNDKTCVEGNIVGPEIIGEFVHYIIRFENTGTYQADNVVVSDVIDTAKFDVASLVPMSGSHSFVTRVQGNKAEFVFNDINLPHEGDGRHGYVAFKVRTLQTLAVGDVFTNTANIYFDYNYPIITDPATTVIEVLSVADAQNPGKFVLYPNPAASVISIKSDVASDVKSVEVYNNPGQLILVNTSSQDLDVSGLAQGVYSVRVRSGKEVSHLKFIKK